MKITKEEVEKLADLARLQLDEKTVERMAVDMDKMLLFIEKLNELDTENLEPLVYMNEDVNVLREDVVTNDFTQKDALHNAPDSDSDYIRVPKVLKRK